MAERVRRQPRAKTREDLLDAAARVVARQGLAGASVDAVSEEAGLSTGAIYSNFRGKEDLFLTLYEERIERRRRELRDAFRDSGGRAAGLRSAAADVDEVFAREREWFVLYFEFALHAARDADFARRFKTLRAEGLAELADGLAAGLAHAGVEPSVAARDLARAVRALSHGLALERLVDDDEGSEPLLGRILELLFLGMRADRGSR